MEASLFRGVTVEIIICMFVVVSATFLSVFLLVILLVGDVEADDLATEVDDVVFDEYVDVVMVIVLGTSFVFKEEIIVVAVTDFSGIDVGSDKV